MLRARSSSATRFSLNASNRRILALFVFAAVGFPPTAGTRDRPVQSQAQKEVVIAKHLKGRILDGKVGKARLDFNESSVTLQIQAEAPETFAYSKTTLRQGRHHLPLKRYPRSLGWYTILSSGLASLAAIAIGPAYGLAAEAAILGGIPNALWFGFLRSPGDRWLSLHSMSEEHRCAFLALPRSRTIREALLAEFLLRLGDEASIPRNLRGGSKNRQAFAAVGSPAPEFSLPDLNGMPHRLSDHRGRVVMLNFWAPWCGPCRREPRGLERLRRNYGENNLAVMGLVDEYPDQVRTLLEEQGIRYPTLHDKDSATFLRYGVTSVPTSIVIDRNGVIVAKDSTTAVTESVAIGKALKVHALFSR